MRHLARSEFWRRRGGRGGRARRGAEKAMDALGWVSLGACPARSSDHAAAKSLSGLRVPLSATRPCSGPPPHIPPRFLQRFQGPTLRFSYLGNNRPKSLHRLARRNVKEVVLSLASRNARDNSSVVNSSFAVTPVCKRRPSISDHQIECVYQEVRRFFHLRMFVDSASGVAAANVSMHGEAR